MRDDNFQKKERSTTKRQTKNTYKRPHILSYTVNNIKPEIVGREKK